MREDAELQAISRIKAGRLIHALRGQKNVSLAEMGQCLSVSANYISEIERGMKAPSDHLLEAIAEYLNFDIDELYYAYNRIPLDVRRELKEFHTLQKGIIEIARNNFSNKEEKQKIYDELYNFIQNLLDENK